jgi:hypothetical protein
MIFLQRFYCTDDESEGADSGEMALWGLDGKEGGVVAGRFCSGQVAPL